MHTLRRIKLRPPRPADDAIARPRLLARLNRLAPLSLIVAPAGYGKTTLMSMWLAQSGLPNTWVSLYEEDNDPAGFLMVAVNAARVLYPQFGDAILELLASPAGRPFAELALMFINELDTLVERFALVLDDYHVIEHPDIHKLLLELSAHPPHAMCLVIATRHDPPLPWHIRSSSGVCEIRERDLRFSAQETAAFLQNMLKQPVETEIALALTEQSEGWPTSLRLAGLYARQRHGVASWVEIGTGSRRNLEDYFASEVLARLSATDRSFLVHTSILDFLHGPLCDFVLSGSAEEGSGAARLRQLGDEGVFITSLEGEAGWWRCHSLFRQVLRRKLNETATAEEIRVLYERAGAWYEDRMLLEEALHYALGDKKDIAYAIAFLRRHRARLLNAFDFSRLEHWLKQFPPPAIATDVDLLLAKCWIMQFRFELVDLGECLPQLDALLAALPPDMPEMIEWQGEAAALRSQWFVFAGEFEQAIRAGRQTLDSIPQQHFYVRGFSLLFVCYGLTLTGQPALADSLLAAAAADLSLARDQALLVSLQIGHYLQLATSDLFAMRAQFPRLLQLATAHNNKPSLAWAHHFWGCASYLQNQLGEAEEHFRAVLDLDDYAHRAAYTHSAIGLALTLQAQGAPHAAFDVMEAAKARLEQMQIQLMLQATKAFCAELAVRQGRIEEGLRWLATDEPLLIRNATPLFFVQELVAPKVLLAAGGEANRAIVRAKLERMKESISRVHNIHAQIQTSALEAALYEAEGDRPQALAALAHAMRLAQAGGVVRIFVDLAPLLTPLFSVFAPDDALADFTASVLGASAISREVDPLAGPMPGGNVDSNAGEASFEASSGPGANGAPAARDLNEILTYREVDVLRLLDLRLTNKEIARRLGISTETVRQHTVNLFRKLQVRNRRQAIVAARAAGFFDDRQ